MKQRLTIMSIIIIAISFSLLFSLSGKILTMTLPELEQEIETYTIVITECEEDYTEREKELSDIEDEYDLNIPSREEVPDDFEVDVDASDDLPDDLMEYDFVYIPDDCNYEKEFGYLETELDNYLKPGAGVKISEMDKAKAKELKIKLDKFIERNENLKKRKKGMMMRVERLKKVIAGASASEPVSELAANICKILKEVIVKILGPVEGVVVSDETHIYGRVIVVDFIFPEGVVLDDSWGPMLVQGLKKEIGINGVFSGNEIRADGGQEIGGERATTMQFTTGTADNNRTSLAFVGSFEKKRSYPDGRDQSKEKAQ